METIVVGVDGSKGAAAALEFAVNEAVLRNARLRLVSAWEVPVSAYGAGLAPVLDAETVDAFRIRAQQVVEDAHTTVMNLEPSLVAEPVAIEGQPAEVLLEQAADATLIVVGNRGLGGFKSLLLGSVSQQVVHHASCPVVVVHQPRAAS